MILLSKRDRRKKKVFLGLHLDLLPVGGLKSRITLKGEKGNEQ
jgi:hypothetical protein